jgi:DNA-binding beta-propeller fold protein YncE
VDRSGGAVPVGVAVNPLTSTVYVTNFRAASVFVLTG